MKNYLLTISAFLCLCHLTLNGQSYTQWEQIEPSDYYVKIDWTVSDVNTCSCYPSDDRHFISYSINPLIQIGVYDYPHPVNQQTQSDSTWIVFGPNRSEIFSAQYKINGGDGPFCIPTCVLSTNSPYVVMTTDRAYPPANVNHTWTADGRAKFTWDVVTDIPASLYKTEIYKAENNGSGGTSIKVADLLGHATTWTDNTGCSTNANYFFVGRYNNGGAGPSITYHVAEYPMPVPPPMGKISGNIETTNGSDVEGVQVEVILQNPTGITNGSCWPTSYSAITDATGAYTIPFIYWGSNNDMAQYKVVPYLENHGFDPGEVTITLQNGDFTKVVDFIDTTAFSIQGFVRDSEGCGVDSAFIQTTSGDFISTFSKPDGSYNLIVPETNSYTIKASVDTFDLGTQNVIVDADVQDKDFDYLATDTLNLYVGAGCFEYIGQAQIDIRAKGGCLLQSVTTNLSGFANEIVLPKREITVEVVSINPPNGSGLDGNEIISKIGGEMAIDLDSTTNINIIYRKPLSLELFGIPAPPCPAISDPVFQQAYSYPITILVWESPGICLADTGYLLIQDNVGAVGLQTNILDTVPISNGIAQYTIIPGEPVLNAPYLKNVSFTAVVDSTSTNTTIQGIVSGSRQRTQTFVTGGPTELPYLILRDPPGDASYSFFNQNESVTYSESYSSKQAGDVRIWAKVRGKTTVFPGIKVFGEIGAGIKAGGSKISSTETKTTLSDFININTSSEQTKIGEDFDLVYGAAVNFIYGLVDERRFDINTCSMIVDTALMFSPDTFETQFITTIKDIRENKIPTLELFATNQDTTEEARIKFRAELKKWEQVIQLNDELKEEALKDVIDNYTIIGDAGPVSLSTTGSVSKSKSIVTSQFINADIAAKAGVDILNETFVIEGGVEVNIRGEWGQSESENITETTTTGFVFDDSGTYDDDNISFDYAIDPVYNTAVFGDPIGRTSCPHEMGTQFVDFPQIVALNPVQYADENETFLFFDLAIRNYSESDDTRFYHIRYEGDDGSARVSFGDDPLSAGAIISRSLASGEQQILKIKVEQNDPDVYSFEGLEFRMFPACQTGLFSSTYINAYFENDCPFVSMPLPNNNFLINQSSNHLMGVVMDDYILNSDIDHIKLKYLPVGTTEWMDSNVDIPGPNLIAPPQQYFWDATTIEDGEYSIRWELKCGNTLNVSPRVSGIIDRKAPRVFGTEKPSDDTFFPGDEISVTFNEHIDILDLQNGNFYVKNITQNLSVPATISADEKTVIVDLGINIDSLYNQNFEIGLIGVTDLYNNARPDTVIWQFLVSEPDSDRDGVGDLTDRCPGGDDCEDTDMDGIPDDCDCLPTIPQNGRSLSKTALDFDGTADYINIPNNPALIPTGTNAVTYETWIYPKASSNLIGIISSSGAWPNRNHEIYIQNTGQLIIGGINVNSMSSNAALPFDEWTHIAVVFDQNQTYLFINGSLDNSRIETLGNTNLGFDVTIGNQFSGSPPGWSFAGKMEEFRIWNGARTQAEISSNMRKELEGNEAGLELYLDFNEGTPFGDNNDLATLMDKSVNGYAISLNNFEKIGTTSNWVFSPAGLINAQYDLCLTCLDSINAAMDFDGVNDFLSLNNNNLLIPTSSRELTMEGWFSAKYLTGYQTIVASFDQSSQIFEEFWFGLENNSLFIQGPNGDSYTAGTVEVNTWNHFAVVWRQGQTKLYLNNELLGVYNILYPAIDNGTPVTIGSAFFPSTSYPFHGQMDDIRFWDHERTAEEIQSNMFHEMLGTESGLLAYFDFNEGLASGDNQSRTFAEDKTGNGFNADFIKMRQFGGYSNYTPSPLNFRIDEDEDGRPDACDNCIPQPLLTLENMTLSGTYRARDKITLGNNLSIPSDSTIYLRAPEIEVLNTISSPSSTRIYVKNKPCDE